jgi:hypothetical protein
MMMMAMMTYSIADAVLLLGGDLGARATSGVQSGLATDDRLTRSAAAVADVAANLDLGGIPRRHLDGVVFDGFKDGEDGKGCEGGR